MLYTVADATWSPGRPVPPLAARAGFFRKRAAAVTIAAGRPVLAAAIRYDPLRGRVVAHGAGREDQGGPWVAAATMNDLGAVTVLAPVPADLVREIGPAELRLHSGHLPAFPRSHVRAPCCREAGRGPVLEPGNRTCEKRTILPLNAEVSQKSSPRSQERGEAPEMQRRRPLGRDAAVMSRVVSAPGAKARRAGGRVLAILTRKSSRGDGSRVEFAEAEAARHH